MKKSGKTAMTTAIFAAVLTASAAFGDEPRNCVWTGAAGDAKWSTPGNWTDNAAPSSGDSVSVSGAGAVNGEIENDIAGLALSKLTFTGSLPFRLKGEGVAFAAEGTCIEKSAAVAVTNALDLALADGTCTVEQTGDGNFVLEGAISGDNSMMHFTGSKSSILMAGNNTYGGGTHLESSNGIALLHPNGFGKHGTVVKSHGSIEFYYGSDINYEVEFPAGGNLKFRNSGIYEFKCPVHGVNSTVQILCGPDLKQNLAPNGTVVFHEPVDFPKAELKNYNLGSGWKVEFRKSACFNRLGKYYGTAAAAPTYEFYAANDIPNLHLSRAQRIHAKTVDAFLCAPVISLDTSMSEGTSVLSGEMDLCGSDQKFDRISSTAEYSNRGIIKTTGAAATLTLAGTGSAYTYAMLADELTVIWNPVDASFTQTFLNRVHTMTGSLIVSNGTLAVEGATSFAGAKRIEIASGARLLVNTTLADAFAAVERIDIARGGTLEIVSGATPFTLEAAVLDIASGASVVLPGSQGCEFLSIVKDGEPLAMGVYDSANLPEVSGGRIISRGETATRVDARWSGGGSGFMASDPANWVGGTVPVLVNGSLYATFGDGGTKVETAAGYDWLGMEFTRDFEVAGSGKLTLRGGGIAAGVQSPCTNVVSVPLWLRAAQEWQVGAGSRLEVNGGVAGNGYGSYSVSKTGPGELHLNAPSPGMGAFTLGSSGVNGGKVVVNTATNAFGEASDQEVTIYSKNSEGTGNLTVAASTVIERPFVFATGSDYGNILKLHEDVEVRFTKYVNLTGNMRMSCDGRNKVVLEGGGKFMDGWLCFSSAWNIAEKWPMTEWIFTGENPYDINYLYMSGFVDVTLDTAVRTLNTFEIKSICALRLTKPYVLDNTVTKGRLNHASAVFSVVGDQSMGAFDQLTAGTVTSPVPSTIYCNQGDSAVTNSGVCITGAVAIFKRGSAIFVQDKDSDTTGGMGVGEGTLVLTEKAKFPNATIFRVEDEGRAELEARNLLGKNTKVMIDSTARLDLAGDQRVKELWVDGVKRPCGIYGSQTSGAPNALEGVSGSGRLIVGDVGMFIRVR